MAQMMTAIVIMAWHPGKMGWVLDSEPGADLNYLRIVPTAASDDATLAAWRAKTPTPPPPPRNSRDVLHELAYWGIAPKSCL